jgi:hypothetical protein
MMHIFSFPKSLVLGLVLALALPASKAQAEGVVASVHSFVGNGLYAAGTGVALGGFCYGTYHAANALCAWIKSKTSKNIQNKQEAIEEGKNSLASSLAGYIVGGCTYGITVMNRGDYGEFLGRTIGGFFQGLSKR